MSIKIIKTKKPMISGRNETKSSKPNQVNLVKLNISLKGHRLNEARTFVWHTWMPKITKGGWSKRISQIEIAFNSKWRILTEELNLLDTY